MPASPGALPAASWAQSRLQHGESAGAETTGRLRGRAGFMGKLTLRILTLQLTAIPLGLECSLCVP